MSAIPNHIIRNTSHSSITCHSRDCDKSSDNDDTKDCSIYSNPNLLSICLTYSPLLFLAQSCSLHLVTLLIVSSAISRPCSPHWRRPSGLPASLLAVLPLSWTPPSSQMGEWVRTEWIRNSCYVFIEPDIPTLFLRLYCALTWCASLFNYSHTCFSIIREVSIRQLASWWILEDCFDSICAFLGETFGNTYYFIFLVSFGMICHFIRYWIGHENLLFFSLQKRISENISVVYSECAHQMMFNLYSISMCRRIRFERETEQPHQSRNYCRG